MQKEQLARLQAEAKSANSQLEAESLHSREIERQNALLLAKEEARKQAIEEARRRRKQLMSGVVDTPAEPPVLLPSAEVKSKAEQGVSPADSYSIQEELKAAYDSIKKENDA